jgi:hypothetical protein
MCVAKAWRMMWQDKGAAGFTGRTYHFTIRPTAAVLIRRPPGSMKSGVSRPTVPAGAVLPLAGTAHRAPTMSGRTSRR